MREFEDRVRDSLHELTGSLVVIAGRPPSQRQLDGHVVRPRRRVAIWAAVLIAVSITTVAVVVAARNDGGVLTTDVPSVPSVPEPDVAVSSEPGETSANPGAFGIGIFPQWMIADSVMAPVVQSVRTSLPVEPVAAGDLSGVIAQLGGLGDDAQLAIVVVHVGTDAALDAEQFGALMSASDRIPQVVIATLHGTDPWVSDNNVLIREAADQHANVIVFDWEDLLTSCPGNCVAEDGRTLLDDGRWFYLEQLASLVGFEIPDRPTAAGDRPIGAVTTDGDAVVIDPSTGAITTVFEAPADPGTSVGRVAVNGDGTTAFVDTCCIPVTGEVFAIDLTDPNAHPESIAFSSVVAASPGSGIAIGGPGGPTISGSGGGVSIPIPTSVGTAIDLDWFVSPKINNPGSPFPEFDGSLAILVRGKAGVSLHTVIDIARFTELAPGVTITSVPDAQIRLAGISGEGDVLIFDPTTPDMLTGYDPVSLTPTTALALPDQAIGAWNDSGNLVWIDTNGTLHTPTRTVPGPFRTART